MDKLRLFCSNMAGLHSSVFLVMASGQIETARVSFTINNVVENKRNRL